MSVWHAPVDAPLPAARVIGQIRFGTHVRRIAPLVWKCLLAGTGLVLFSVIARLAAQLGFSYPQTAFLIGLVAVVWIVDGTTGARARW